MTTSARVRLLDGVAVLGDRHVELSPGKAAAVLTVLALHAGRTVAQEALVDAVWGERPPSSARALVHTYVSSLRRALATEPTLPPLVLTVAGGYRLDVCPEQVDALALLALAARDDATADDLAAALLAWKGPVLPGLAESYAAPWHVRLEAARARIRERLWQLRLPQDPASLLPDLRAAVLDDPFHEEAVLLLAQALHTLGRPDESLEELDRYRRRLARQYGLDPSARVGEIHASVLSGGRKQTRGPGASVDLNPDPEPPYGEASAPTVLVKRRKVLLLAGLGAVIAATAGAALAVGTGTHPPQLLPGPSLLLLETTSGDLRAAVRLPTEPAEVAVFGNLAWVTSREQSTVAAIDLAAAEVTSVIGLPQPPTALTAVGDVATVGLAYSGELVRTAGARAEPPQTAIPGRSGRLALATDGQAVWVATVDGFIAPQGTGDAPLRVEGAPRRLAVDSQRVWALTFDRSELVSVHRRTDALVRSSLRGTPVDVSSDQGSAFAVTSVDNRLWRADPASGRVVATRALPGPPTAVAAADGRVWVSIRSPAMLISYDGGSLQPGPAVELPTQPADMDITGEHMVVVLR